MSESQGLYPNLPLTYDFKTSPPSSPTLPPKFEHLTFALSSTLQFTFVHSQPPENTPKTFYASIQDDTGQTLLSSTMTGDQEVKFNDSKGRPVLISSFSNNVFTVSSDDTTIGQVRASYGQTKAKITAKDSMGIEMFKIESSGRGYAEYEIIHQGNGTQIGKTKQHLKNFNSIILTISPNFDTASKGLILVMAHLLFVRFIQDSAPPSKSCCELL